MAELAEELLASLLSESSAVWIGFVDTSSPQLAQNSSAQLKTTFFQCLRMFMGVSVVYLVIKICIEVVTAEFSCVKKRIAYFCCIGRLYGHGNLGFVDCIAAVN